LLRRSAVLLVIAMVAGFAPAHADVPACGDVVPWGTCDPTLAPAAAVAWACTTATGESNCGQSAQCPPFCADPSWILPFVSDTESQVCTAQTDDPNCNMSVQCPPFCADPQWLPCDPSGCEVPVAVQNTIDKVNCQVFGACQHGDAPADAGTFFGCAGGVASLWAGGKISGRMALAGMAACAMFL
jgi:hypothetical protein